MKRIRHLRDPLLDEPRDLQDRNAMLFFACGPVAVRKDGSAIPGTRQDVRFWRDDAMPVSPNAYLPRKKASPLAFLAGMQALDTFEQG
ncbi:MAG TPA: hypothetical protein VFV38_26885, partial [Ktedonobacteraceae bacterium]|nr:hypothetical protein [Ktedonobacteraceae bacterium]